VWRWFGNGDMSHIYMCFVTVCRRVKFRLMVMNMSKHIHMSDSQTWLKNNTQKFSLRRRA
jgi:hypothetical protein